MELSRSLIHMNNLKGRIVTQVTLDDDFNVPDVNADIDKYITRDALVHIENVKGSEGRVNVRGHMDFKILYGSSTDKRKIHSMENSIPFDEMINGDKIGSNDIINEGFPIPKPSNAPLEVTDTAEIINPKLII